MKHWQKFLIIFVILSVLIGFGTISWWESGVYKAETVALKQVTDNLTFEYKEESDKVTLINKTSSSNLELVYFPGAKVDSNAYLKRLSLVSSLANIKKIIVIKPAFHFALLSTGYNVDKPENTIIMGHSVGGVAACEVAKKYTVRALILEASYCNGGGEMNEPVLGIYGDQDGLQSVEKVESELNKITSKKLEKIKITGLNHANFGWYGKQSGDKEAIKNHDESDLEIAIAISKFLNKN
jgi:Alpha/beta hydrolase family